MHHETYTYVYTYIPFAFEYNLVSGHDRWRERDNRYHTPADPKGSADPSLLLYTAASADRRQGYPRCKNT